MFMNAPASRHIKPFAVIAWIGVFSASVGAAAAKDSTDVAHALGQVLAAEEACGFSYDQAAIEAFIDKNVEANDMEFTGTLALLTGGSEYELKQMSASQKTAHCRQVGRVAKSYGFTH
ncbi:MAG: signal recognition particle [Proteobacteria bacterium]|nr:signal recognition particle [Pseudomonadota bacterium]